MSALHTHGLDSDSSHSTCDVFVPHIGWITYESGDNVGVGLVEGDFEYQELAIVTRFLRPGDVFIDCGAHCGLYSRLALTCVEPRGYVAAIEPDPQSFRFLVQNTIGHSARSLTCHQIALGGTDGTVAFQRQAKGRSAFNCVASEPNSGTIEIRQETLPTFLQRLPVNSITIMKMDCEGSELAILRAAEPLLARGNPRVLMLEFNQENLNRYGGSCRELAELLGRNGYKFLTLAPEQDRLIEADPKPDEEYANYFATNAPEWLHERFAQAPKPLKQSAASFLQRGTCIDQLKKRLLGTIGEQTAYIATLEKARERLTAEANTAKADAVAARAESQHHLDSLKAQLDSTVARYEQSIAELRPQVEQSVQRYEALITPLREQLDQLAATSQKQTALIAVLEKERDRFASEAVAAKADAISARSESQHHIDSLKAQLDSTVARYEQSIAELRPQVEQSVQRYEALITPLREQLDQLAATSQEQTALIAVLEKERDRLAAEAVAAKADAVTARAESQHHIDSLKAQLDSTVARYEQSIAELRPQVEQSVQRYEALIAPLREQLDQLAATSRQQSEFIAILGKERDRLAKREDDLLSETKHYLEVIAEQLAYIQKLEGLQRTQAPSAH